MRAAASSKFVLFSICAVPTAITLLAALRSPSFWAPFALCVLITVSVLVWLHTLRIQIQEGELICHSVFRSPYRLPLPQLQRIEVLQGVQSYLDRFKPEHRVIIHPRPECGLPRYTINLKPFRSEDIRRFFELCRVHRIPGTPRMV